MITVGPSRGGQGRLKSDFVRWLQEEGLVQDRLHFPVWFELRYGAPPMMMYPGWTLDLVMALHAAEFAAHKRMNRCHVYVGFEALLPVECAG